MAAFVAHLDDDLLAAERPRDLAGAGPDLGRGGTELGTGTRDVLVTSSTTQALWRAHGRFLTPGSVARQGVESVRAHFVGRPARVVDLAAGEGVWLTAAREVFGRGVELLGVEIDAEIARRCAETLRQVGGPSAVVVGDGTTVPLAAQADVVLGNPPFRSPRLRSVRFDALAPVDWHGLRRRFGGTPTTDLSAYFFARGYAMLREGGVLAMIMPSSFVSAEGSRFVRELVERSGRLLEVRPLERGTFAAEARPVMVVVQRDGHGGEADWTGALSDAPRLTVTGAGRLSEVAVIRAGFRREFYALSELVRPGTSDSGRPVVTVGSIGRQGVRPVPVRIGGRRFERPVVPEASLPQLPVALRRLLVPKVLVAPQKPLILPVVDATGDALPLTPIASVIPHGPVSVRALAAVLASPVTSALVDRARAGAALSPGHLVASVGVLRALPLPTVRDAWREASRALASGAGVAEVAEPMVRAYGRVDQDASSVLAWWTRRFEACS